MNFLPKLGGKELTSKRVISHRQLTFPFLLAVFILNLLGWLSSEIEREECEEPELCPVVVGWNASRPGSRRPQLNWCRFLRFLTRLFNNGWWATGCQQRNERPSRRQRLIKPLGKVNSGKEIKGGKYLGLVGSTWGLCANSDSHIFYTSIFSPISHQWCSNILDRGADLVQIAPVSNRAPCLCVILMN